MTKLTTRQAKPEDIGQIHACLADLAAYLGETDLFQLTPENLQIHGFGDTPSFSVLIGEKDQTVAGICLYFKTFSTWFGTPGIYVQDLYIKPEFRNHQFGEKLLAAAAREASTFGATHLRLSVDRSNTQAMAFYDRLGMSKQNKEQIRMLDGLDFENLAEATAD